MIPLPSAFVERLQHHPEAQAILKAFDHEAPTAIRINPFKSQKPPLKNISWCENGFFLAQRPKFTFDPRFHASAYYVQDASCMLLEAVLKQICPKARRILDLCAAPGGKTTHLASLYPESLIVANEVIQSRVKILVENVERWGHPALCVSHWDPRQWEQRSERFDLIVVDAPCSGEGLFRKDPQARQLWSPENAQLCAQRQERILKHAWQLLADQGVLVYSTCTYNPEENQAQLKHLQNWGAQPLNWSLPSDWPVKTWTEMGFCCLQTWPHLDAGEGFFLTAVRKNQTETAPQQSTEPQSRKKNRPTKTAVCPPEVQAWVNSGLDLQIKNQEIWGYPTETFKELEHLKKDLYAPPLRVARAKGKTWVPQHQLAFSPFYCSYFPDLELDFLQSIAYLQGQSLTLSTEHKGVVRLCYEGFPLGWGKATQGRLNNLYPTGLRIRRQLQPQEILDHAEQLQALLPLKAK